MNFRLKIWRQKNRQLPGKLADYKVNDISPDTSFLEMLDILNEDLLQAGEEPVAFDSDCREGICGYDHDRAVSRRRVPNRERSRDRSQCAGSDRASRRIRLRARGLGARG